MSLPLLEGHAETLEETLMRELSERITQLEDRVSELHEGLRQANNFIVLLRRQFAPLSGKGEIPSPAGNDKIEKWKTRFGPTGSRLIEILEVAPSTRNKLRPALECGWSTLDALLKKFKDVGLVEKDGDFYRLRP